MSAQRRKMINFFHLIAILDANSVVLRQIVAGLDGDHIAGLEVTVTRHRAETDSNCKSSNERKWSQKCKRYFSQLFPRSSNFQTFQKKSLLKIHAHWMIQNYIYILIIVYIDKNDLTRPFMDVQVHSHSMASSMAEIESLLPECVTTQRVEANA